MALHNLLWTKPPTPYFKPAPIHICVVLVAEQPRVVSWEFAGNGARPSSTKLNKVAVISDGKSVTKVTVFEQFANRFQQGGSYVLKGHGLRGQSPPYLLDIQKDTKFFRSAPIVVTEELQKQAEAAIRPLSLLTPLSSCREAKGLMTVEGEVVELSALKKITVARDVIPMRNIKLQQGDTQMGLCLWREAAVDIKVQIGTLIKVSHLKGTVSDYGLQLQSTNYSKIEEVSSEDVVGAFGVMDVEDEPGTLSLLLDDGRTVLIPEALWTPIEEKMVDPPIRVQIKLAGNRVQKIEIVK